MEIIDLVEDTNTINKTRKEEEEPELVELSKVETSAPTVECNKEENVEIMDNGKKEDAREGGQQTIEEGENGENGENEENEEHGSDSYDMYLDDSVSEHSQVSRDEEGPHIEVPLTDAEVEELIAEFLEVESKAAEAQESLEKESLAQIESEVCLELSESLQGDELDSAVLAEMDAFKAQWEAALDELETRSSILLEQLDGAGVELPSLYKYIEGQIPNACRTEAWKRRAHWVGSKVTGEVDQSVKDAEEFLQSCRPVRRKHGRLLEEGASGFLAGKLSITDNSKVENNEASWSSFNKLVQSGECSDSGFGSSNWASVYLASTPQQAASLGLNFPGVDEVEEIADIEGDDTDFKNLNELELSEEQQRKYKKVREEDDEHRTRRLQHHLKRERKRRKRLQPTLISDSVFLSNGHHDPTSEEHGPSENGESTANIYNNEKDINCNSKRLREEEDNAEDNKRRKTVLIDSDDELTTTTAAEDTKSKSQIKKSADLIDLDAFPSPAPNIKKDQSSKQYKCTVCSDLLKSFEVHSHPVLQVIVCGSCKFILTEKIRLEGPETGGYCKWCGKCDELVSCYSCKMQFCMGCIERNLGEKFLSDAKANTSWRCFCCWPIILENLVSECQKALSGVSPELSSSESGSELSEPENGVAVLTSKKRRKKRIRRILEDAELAEETKNKIAIEKARQEHLKSMLVQSAKKMPNKSFGASSATVSQVSLQDVKEGLIINLAREKDEESVRIPRSISVKLKPHQIAGIRFMWENVIQSVQKVKSGDQGLGCILAHTMGLGKTFQVIAFLYTVMRGIDLGLRTALIVTPVNVLHNWKKEFSKWQPTELKPLRVYLLEDVPRVKRPYLLAKWRVKGGVLLMGYASFRNLLQGRHVKDTNVAHEISLLLQNTADILVCDEAHLIKNKRADTTQALKQVKTQRRIALTGSPLQNNLMEYYCMVDFVREGYLGSSHEFRNRFQNPIENGQHANSTADDVKIMNQRSHILYEQLKGFVQRMDMNVVKRDLPPKTVFVITVKLSQLQRRLYRKFLDVHGFTGGGPDTSMKLSCFFAGYQTLAQIWNHPGLLQLTKEQKKQLKREDAIENFLDELSSSDENMENEFLAAERQKLKNDLLSKRSDSILTDEEKWWKDLLGEKIYGEVDYSGKMVLLLDILSMSSELGDKSLVFSQSLATLDLIEFYLSKLPLKGREGKCWKQGKDWFRIDGSTPALERQNLVERFNDPTNLRVKCTLISTRAGSLGINLHAANRVILVDGSWNPTYDLQAIYRVWRYGQTKPVYAYRLMAHGTMEEKIYKRQVTKEGLAARVVDRQQVHRTMSKEEMLHLFEFGDEDVLDQNKEIVGLSNQDESGGVGCVEEQKSVPPHQFGCPDELMLNLLSRHQPRWIANYHEHETLLQENEAERLTKEEQEMAWLNFQKSLEWEEVHRTVFEDYPERKPTTVDNNNKNDNNYTINSTTTENPNIPQQAKAGSSSNSQKSWPANQRKCSNLAHLLTLRSSGTKAGCSTTCAECGQEISWENLNRDGRSR